jgi:nucleotide-binding universal stress UspA family protein
MIKKILLATDGSANSRKALGFAVDMASRYDAELHVLHVIQNMEVPLEVLEYISAEEIEDSPASFYLEKIGKKIIKQSENECKINGCENVYTIVLRGDPADMIIEVAQDKQMDLIVLGSRGLRGVKGRLLGSVSRKVSHASEVSCLIVK